MGARAGAAMLGVIAFLVAAPALAEGPSPVVEATDNEFFPKTLTVPPGTTVYWENRGINHNVKFDDGQFEEPPDPSSTPWRVWRTFDTPGVYGYYDEAHGGPGGQGMSGTITVEAGAEPHISGLTVSPYTICDRRTRKCRTTGATLSFTLDEDARVSGGIDPVGAPAGRGGRDLDLKGKQGKNSFPVSSHNLKAGRYKVTLTAEDTDGNESDTATAYMRVKHAVPSKHKRHSRHRSRA
ncbi:MAG: plastocyanin/azurin family copper-binding protein [Thermoleophilaceae bacterium]